MTTSTTLEPTGTSRAPIEEPQAPGAASRSTEYEPPRSPDSLPHEGAEPPWDGAAAGHEPALTQPLGTLSLGAVTAAALAACGGGDVDDGSADGKQPDDTNRAPSFFGKVQAARLMQRASFGADRATIDRVVAIGQDAWLEEQFNAPATTRHVDWLRAQGYENYDDRFNSGRLDHSVWRKFVSGDDTLRQRVVYTLSQIFVVGLDSIDGYWPDFSVGHYLDMMEANAFGSFRKILEDVTLSCAMGDYLSMRGSRKADASGRRPDENYAREVMQLFTIGLVELNPDGSPKLSNGSAVETYTEADVSGLARVFTGWDRGPGFSETQATEVLGPMVNSAQYHENGTKVFLGTTIPANTNAVTSLRIALDRLFNHPNVGPFIGRQLIQRLVTSNPSPAYIARVSAAFANNGSGVRGDMKAVIRAVIVDREARAIDVDVADGTRAAREYGKLREPVLRFVQWARATKVRSPSGRWELWDLSSPADGLGQSPMHAPSVFNFYRPGYVPPNTVFADAGKVAPEFQITTESSVASYVNFMQWAIGADDGIYGSDLVSDFSAWVPLAADAATLAAEINLVFAANRLRGDRLRSITDALASMPAGDNSQRLRRVQAAMLLVMASPEYLVQK
jgi:uncharacterized protein (DUF1800 family)